MTEGKVQMFYQQVYLMYESRSALDILLRLIYFHMYDIRPPPKGPQDKSEGCEIIIGVGKEEKTNSAARYVSRNISPSL